MRQRRNKKQNKKQPVNGPKTGHRNGRVLSRPTEQLLDIFVSFLLFRAELKSRAHRIQSSVQISAWDRKFHLNTPHAPLKLVHRFRRNKKQTATDRKKKTKRKTERTLPAIKVSGLMASVIAIFSGRQLI